ncbi:MAG: FGGY family carbohydrate kinase [Solidesulfovibrio sp.]
MSKYVLSLDQGTTSSRAILFTREGDIKQISQKEFTQIYPQPGWVEHNANEIFDTQSWVMRECLTHAEVDASEVAAVGIANQRETTLLWERASGRPVHNAIVWQDRRTAGFCDALGPVGTRIGCSRSPGW